MNVYLPGNPGVGELDWNYLDCLSEDITGDRNGEE
jgi:hypothetical protein